MAKPPSKASQTRKAYKTLMALLRTPKTRLGLVAAVQSAAISKNYVFGFLSEGRRTGTLTTHRSGQFVMWQVATAIVDEKPIASEYPSWLDPRTLPTSSGRSVVVDGETIRVN